MARVSYVDLLPELKKSYFSGVKSSDRFVFSRIVKKTTLLSVKKKKGITLRSLLPQITTLWNGFSAGEKTAWNTAAAESGLSGFQLFFQDQALRIKNELPGVVTPSLLHQSLVGQLHVGSPATELEIIQTHPHFYWISKKVKGKKGMYEPVLVTENLSLPVTISLNYRAELEPTGPGSFAKLFARFWHSYQGADQYTDLEIPLDSYCNWKSAEATLTTLIGYVIRYDLYLHIYNLTGNLYLDNVKVEHDLKNWARDPNCKDINQGFTRAFYQIPKHWAGVTVPEGAWYESAYKDFMPFSRARAYRATSAQAIPTAVETKIQLNAENWDVQDEFDISNYRFVAKKTGYHQINVQIYWASAMAGSMVYLTVRKNQGASVAIDYITAPPAGEFFQRVSDIVYLTEGDQLEVFAYQNSGSDKNIGSGSSNTFMAIAELPA